MDIVSIITKTGRTATTDFANAVRLVEAEEATFLEAAHSDRLAALRQLAATPLASVPTGLTWLRELPLADALRHLGDPGYAAVAEQVLSLAAPASPAPAEEAAPEPAPEPAPDPAPVKAKPPKAAPPAS